MRRRRRQQQRLQKSQPTMPAISKGAAAVFEDWGYNTAQLLGKRGSGKNGSITKKDAVKIVTDWQDNNTDNQEEE